MSEIDSMLTNCFTEGYTVDNLKNSVIETLSPYFQHKDALRKFWTDAEILSAYEFIIRYHYDRVFLSNLAGIVDLYQSVYEQYPDKTLDIITDTLWDFSQKENIMFYKRNDIPAFESEELYEVLIKAMEHIGNILEIGVKPTVAELWACTKLLSKGSVDYKTIRELKFGTTVQNLINSHRFEEILKTEPQQLKLSDWRNIAYHHSYQILRESEIQCTYGKNNSHTFTMSQEELKLYTGQIVCAANALYIARILFIFDNLEMIHHHCNNVPALYLSQSLEKSSIETSFLSQGYKLISIKEDGNTVIADLQDLIDTTSMSGDEKKKRWIQMSQYQLPIWKLTRKSRVVENYFSTK